ncbi:MAG: ATP-sensitive inward rectifier potassium channel 10 [Deltaproteobacteria bacterium]|nr:ATP-sensitive inward rectifier potassium channel 10 [Deltaproteobacteria bacterium]
MSAPIDLPEGARRVPQAGGYSFWLVGETSSRGRDLYHNFLRMPWPASLGLIAAGFFAVNLVFATIYVLIGGVDNMPSGSFWNALVFSVETLGTIGYGVMYPKSPAAEIVMMIEAVTGLIVTALATGLVFTKFARATARVAFTTNMVITSFEGKPTLMFRLGNRRANVIVQAQLAVVMSLTIVTAEGETFYKLHDLKLVRDRMAGMRRGWAAMHVIDETSPLHGLDAAALKKAEAEFEVSLTGLDDVTMQAVHSIHIYTDDQIKFGYRFADTMRPLAGTPDFVLDLRQFDVVVPDSTPRDSVAA